MIDLTILEGCELIVWLAEIRSKSRPCLQDDVMVDLIKKELQRRDDS